MSYPHPPADIAYRTMSAVFSPQGRRAPARELLPMRDDLLDFISAARAKSVPDATILLLLRNQGWSERRAQSALAAYYARELDLAVPAAGGHTSSY